MTSIRVHFGIPFSGAWIASFLSAMFLPGGLLREASAQEQSAEQLCTLEILPLLKAKCVAYRSESACETKGDFDASSLAGLLRGGESDEPAITPGDAAASILYQAVMWDGYISYHRV